MTDFLGPPPLWLPLAGFGMGFSPDRDDTTPNQYATG